MRNDRLDRIKGLGMCAALVAGLGGCTTQYAPVGEAVVEAPGDGFVEDQGRAPEVVEAGLTLETCGPVQAWSSEFDPDFMEPEFLEVSPEHGLLVRASSFGSSRAFRLWDGQPLFWMNRQLQRHSVDRDWHVVGGMVWEEERGSLALSHLVTGESVQEVGTEGRFQQVLLAPDASWLVGLACEVQDLEVVGWRLDEPAPRTSEVIEGGCLHQGFYPSLPAQVTSQGRLALGLGHGELVVMELSTGQWRSVEEAHKLRDPQEGTSYAGAILALAVDPEGRRVATTGQDGALRLWALDSLEPLGTERVVATNPINLFSYLPSESSPVAWSPDGRLLAYMVEGGEAVLERVEDGAVVLRVPAPEVDPEVDPALLRIDAFNGLTFDRRGQTLIVSRELTMESWRCPQVERPVGAPLNVLIEGPREARVGQAVTFLATHLGTDHLHGHQFFVNGEPVGVASMGRELAWTPERPGTYEITVQIDDGLAQGTASMRVSVR